MSAVIRVEDLYKSFRTPLQRKKVSVLNGLSFTVEPGEVFGFLGPNGAGKTTTIRILMGLITATSGRATIFGEPVPSRQARARLGFLPETPYFYDYLTVAEMLDLTGRLFGIDRRERRRRVEQLIERVGLGHARGKPLKKYSKGMLQRAGLAQALINDPELVVLDEPTSGLDPVGRKEVRDIIASLRERGKTVFFSSHILADVEQVSDRVAIVIDGHLRDIGPLDTLVDSRIRGTNIALRLPETTGDTTDNAAATAPGEATSEASGEAAPDAPGEAAPDATGEAASDATGEAASGATGDPIVDALGAGASQVRRQRDTLTLVLEPEADVDAYLARARDLGARVISVIPRRETLEEVFLRHAQGRDHRTDAQGDAA